MLTWLASRLLVIGAITVIGSIYAMIWTAPNIPDYLVKLLLSGLLTLLVSIPMMLIAEDLV